MQQATWIDYTPFCIDTGWSELDSGFMLRQGGAILASGFKTAGEARKFAGHPCKWTERALEVHQNSTTH